MDITNNGITLTTPELVLLRFNKEGGYNYRFRREQDWRENYTLYRDRVIYNRLTQRQSVNLPLMKTQIRTLLKDVDDMPVIQFDNLDNDKESEVFLNEYWKDTLEQNNMEIKDIIDKKQEFFFGRSFDQMQVIDGRVVFNIIDPEDILVDRYLKPDQIDSSRFLIHTHIFKPLAELELDPAYDKEALNRLKIFYATNMGLIKAKANLDMLSQKNQKMADLGLMDADAPVLGETYVELTMHLIKRKEENETEEQIYLYTEADSLEILQKKPLEEVIGETSDGEHYWRTHYNYNTWAEDVDQQDFWTDGVADIIKTPNKVLNTWFSQMVENRTLKNLNMNLYDATKEGFVPQTYEPKAFGWYGVPGKPSDVYQQLQIGDLSDALPEMQFVMDMVDRATGATATQQGATQSNIQLGQVQLALVEAKERVRGLSKFYTQAWKERGTKFLKLIDAASDKLDAVRIYKKGRNTDTLFSQVIDPSDWETKSGYRTRVWSQEDKNTQDTQKLQKLSAAVQNMPGNPKLMEIYDRKLLEFADLQPEEINEVMEVQQQIQQQMMNQAAMMGAQQPGGQPVASTPGMPQQTMPQAQPQPQPGGGQV
jgi:hypothetical protein